MDFNFSNLGQTNFTSAAGAYLKPFDIYTVNLTKIEKTTIKGSKDPNVTYPVIALEFTGTGDSKGVFTTNIFIPTTQDDIKRPVYKNNEGHEYEAPSKVELFQYTLMQIVHALNPAGEEKIKANGSKIKTIDQFTELVLKALVGKNNVETKLKLVGTTPKNGVVYATLPKPCGLTKAGEVFPKNFIGGDDVLLAFDNYELQKMNEYKNAKPTRMPEVTNDSDVNVDDIDDLDL